MRNRWWLAALVSVLSLTVVGGGPALGDTDDRCTQAVLDGLYVFTATGFTSQTAPAPALPKAIVELIRFDGNGGLTVPAVTVSVNGFIPPPPAVNTGIYTVSDVPGDDACSGTLHFDGGGQNFNLAFAHNAKTLYMIQTNPGSVFQGTAVRLSH